MVQSGARKKECLRILLWLIPCAHYETGNQAFSMCLRFLTIRVSDLRQRGLVSFRKKQSALDLGFQDTVLRSQIFVPHQQFLIDGARDVGQHASPNHFCASWLMELRRSWIVGLIEALEKAIRRDSSRLQASPFQTGRIS